MRLLKGVFFVALLATACACFGDSLIGNFTIKNGRPFPSGGTVTFDLNVNGTISATLISFGFPIVGFGFNSTTELPESGFTPTTPLNTHGWIDMYGTQRSGFACSCGNTESWLIGTPGEFTSVLQALGGTTSQYDFFLVDTFGNEWAGNRVPEPASLMLLGSGLLGLGAVNRKRRKKA
jgi:PEP-CTERM motif